jgi:hypothetical protein
MKEPELAERGLTTRLEMDSHLIIDYHQLDDGNDPKDPMITIEGPDLKHVTPLIGKAAGKYSAAVLLEKAGLYKITLNNDLDDEHKLENWVALGTADQLETRQILLNKFEKSGLAISKHGGIYDLEKGLPSIRYRRDFYNDQFAGQNWMGLKRNDIYITKGRVQHALIPTWLLILAFVISLILAWRIKPFLRV